MVLVRRLKNEASVELGENSAIRGHSRIDYYENLSIGKNSGVNYDFQALGRNSYILKTIIVYICLLVQHNIRYTTVVILQE
jgi:hypothetical protein